MSKTIKAQVLEQARELWKDPKNRIAYRLEDGRGGYCALGVLSHADFLITGRASLGQIRKKLDELGSLWPTAQEEWTAAAHRATALIDWEGTGSELAMHNNASQKNRNKLYRCMGEHLAKELA
jgi:hypothetical protein